MAKWQKNELANEDLVVLIGMTENDNMVKPEPKDLRAWQAKLDLDCTMLADPAWVVADTYMFDNFGGRNFNAVTVLIDKNMTIRDVRGTDVKDISLKEIQALLRE